MKNKIRAIERKWIGNFKRSPLVVVDKGTAIYQSGYAYQLFYGNQSDSSPSDFAHGFLRFYETCDGMERNIAVKKLIAYLGFVGIVIREEAILLHLEKFPEDFKKLTKKCYHILKMLAHYGPNLSIDNPYKDNNNDLFFLLRIESGESIHGGQLHLFEELDLPVLHRKISQLPNGYGDDVVIQRLFDKIENSSQSFFITGKAGTGKSTFIHYFAQKTKKKVLMTAFTGIAAINVGGQTIHSLFNFPFKPLLPEDDEIAIFKNYSQKYKIIEKIDTIVIDEVSMLRSDILEGIDYSLRKNGGDPNKRFGGKQLLFVGDIFQLPPVVNSTDEVEAQVFSEVYDSEYFFDAPAYKNINPMYLELKKSHRQGDDLHFVQLLDEVRICKATAETLQKLNERYDPVYSPRADEFVITLTATNAVANAENARRLLGLTYTKFEFAAEIKGEFSEDRYPTAKLLELKKDAQVIFIKNDSGGSRWVNGTIAKIDFISSGLLEIRLQNGNIYKVEKATWENRRYKYDKENRKIVSEVIGTFTQFPIKLAWAITIHKSQGLTFDNVIIDLGTGAFINGQIYTALSRCRTLQGITLKRRLRQEDIIADRRVLDFHQTEQLLDALE